MERVTFISAFGTSELAGHSLLDDEYYFRFLLESGADFRYFARRYSRDRMSVGCAQAQDGNLYALEDGRPRIRRSERVVYVGYREVDVLGFLSVNFLRTPRLVLVATNNFSRGRVLRHSTLLRTFLALVAPFTERLVVHTGFEVDLVRSLNHGLADRVFVKRHHLMIPTRAASAAPPDGTPVITYFGPSKPDKPVEPVIDLIKADRDGRFRYRLFQVEPRTLAEQGVDVVRHSNVELVGGWQSQAAYREALAASSLVMLTHALAFEGKLSGNLCDCVAMGIPYLSRAMEPVTSYHHRYGPMGYTCDFEDPEWASRFVTGFAPDQLLALRANLGRMAQDHVPERIAGDLTAAFLGSPQQADT